MKKLSQSKINTINKATKMMEEGKTSSALSLIRKHIGHNTDTFLFFSGWKYYLNGEYERAIKNWELALQANPSNSDALNYLTNAYIEIGMLEEAEICARSALWLSKDLTSYKLLVQVLFTKGGQEELSEALDLLSEIAHVDQLDANKQIVAVLIALYKFDLAEKFAYEVLEKEPLDPYTLRNLATIYTNTRRIDEAINTLDKISTPDAQYQKGMLQLLKGEYANGWKNHEQRLFTDSYGQRHILEKLPRLSRHNKDHFRNILVYQEQGIGDMLQMSRYLPLFREFCLSINPECKIDWGLTRNIYNPDSPLKDFMQLNYSAINCLEMDDFTLSKHNYSSCISVFSLPLLLQLDYIPKQKRFVTDVSFEELEGSTNIGICWRGSDLNISDELRSNLHYSKLLSPEYTWVPLQLESTPNSLFTHMPVGTLSELAATIQTLDLVITVDTMVGHLAAGLGVETWIMLPYAADWRWGMPKDTRKLGDNDWYDNVRLIRQTSFNNWGSVTSQIQEMLARRKILLD